MPAARFTARWVQSIQPPTAGQIDYFDTNRLGPGRNFGLRVSAKGRKSWIVLYRHHGKTRRLTLGSYPDLGLADARDEADRQVKAIIEGRDPAAEKQAVKTAPTFGELADDYIEKYAKRHKRSWKADQTILNRDVLPAWRDHKAHEIKRRHVIDLLDGITERGAGILANRTLATVRRLFNWAIERDVLEVNPCFRVKPPAKERQRDRVLGVDEIKALWAVLDSPEDVLRISEPVRLVLRLILVTAQRKGEIVNAKQSEFDLDAGWWTIPAERSKNGLSHRVPLSPLAIEFIGRAIALAKDSDLLFPSPRRPEEGEEWKPILDSAVDQAVRKNREVFGLEHFTPHDLRRTAASHMTAAGISRLLVSKILNHVESGITAVYDRHSYDAEKRQALHMWGRKLAGIIEGGSADNVIALGTR